LLVLARATPHEEQKQDNPERYWLSLLVLVLNNDMQRNLFLLENLFNVTMS
jgi:hypothetical protein